MDNGDLTGARDPTFQWTCGLHLWSSLSPFYHGDLPWEETEMDPTRCIAVETIALLSFGFLKAEDANDERLARELTADYDDISDSVGLSLTMLGYLPGFWHEDLPKVRCLLLIISISPWSKRWLLGYHSTILGNMHVLVLKSLTWFPRYDWPLQVLPLQPWEMRRRTIRRLGSFFCKRSRDGSGKTSISTNLRVRCIGNTLLHRLPGWNWIGPRRPGWISQLSWQVSMFQRQVLPCTWDDVFHITYKYVYIYIYVIIK